MRTPPLSNALQILGLCMLGWGLAQGALWMHLEQRARNDRQQHQLGLSRLQFALNDPADLIGGAAQDVREQQFSDQGLRVQFGPGAANIPIGFDGQCLSTHRFPMLSLDLHSSEPLQLALVQSPQAGGAPRISELSIDPATQRLRLDMRQLHWHQHDAVDQPALLGDENGLVCEFRLVPVATKATELRLANLQFALADLDPANMAQAQTWPDAIAISVLGRRPETVLLERDALRTHADVEIWPTALPKDGVAFEVPDRSRIAWLALLLPVLAGLLRHHPRLAVWTALAGPIALLSSNRIGSSSGIAEVLCVGLSAICLLMLAPRADGSQTHSRFRIVGDRPAWRSAMAGLVSVLAIAALLYWIAGIDPRRPPTLLDLSRYLLWAAFQQTLLQRVLIPRLRRPTTRNRPAGGILAGLSAACAFALLHTPNLSLMGLCLLAGLWWTWHFNKYQAWLPLVLVHVCLGAVLPMLLPVEWLYSAEVGERFFTAPD